MYLSTAVENGCVQFGEHSDAVVDEAAGLRRCHVGQGDESLGAVTGTRTRLCSGRWRGRYQVSGPRVSAPPPLPFPQRNGERQGKKRFRSPTVVWPPIFGWRRVWCWPRAPDALLLCPCPPPGTRQALTFSSGFQRENRK